MDCLVILFVFVVHMHSTVRLFCMLSLTYKKEPRAQTLTSVLPALRLLARELALP